MVRVYFNYSISLKIFIVALSDRIAQIRPPGAKYSTDHQQQNNHTDTTVCMYVCTETQFLQNHIMSHIFIDLVVCLHETSTNPVSYSWALSSAIGIIQ